MHAEHHKRSIRNEAVEPPKVIIITSFSGGVLQSIPPGRDSCTAGISEQYLHFEQPEITTRVEVWYTYLKIVCRGYFRTFLAPRS